MCAYFSKVRRSTKGTQMSGAVTLFVSSAQAIVICPSCQTVTSKVHSRYERAAADLPWEGIPVRLRLQNIGSSRLRRYF